ncbi:MAG TPA: hypothetical protein VNO31_15435 [Umezawaea sp.]|nr:hypothetical protein [Umezawaea sp.]
MLPGTDTASKADITARVDAYDRAADLLPEDADPEQVMRVAEWLNTGAALLDPARLAAAARVLVDVSSNYTYDAMSAQSKATYEGQAAQVVTAYLTAGAR